MSTSPVTAAKNMQGYQGALQRKRCGSCQHAVECYAGSWQCRKGGFMVTVYAVCTQWEMRQPPGFKRPNQN